MSPLNIPSFHPKNNSNLTILLCNTLTGLLEAAEAPPVAEVVETGRSAPQTPSAGMDAAAVCTLVV